MLGCCHIKHVCGRNLLQGAKYVSIATIVLGKIFLIISFSILIVSSRNNWDSRNAVTAVYYVSALVGTSISLYQIAISAALFWTLYRTKDNTFVGSVWYVSHVSIIIIYVLMFAVLTVVSAIHHAILLCLFTLLIGTAYSGILVYFAIAINSFINSLDVDRYL